MRNLLHGFDIYLVDAKTMRKMAQIFVAFSEKSNFINLFESVWNGGTKSLHALPLCVYRTAAATTKQQQLC